MLYIIRRRLEDTNFIYSHYFLDHQFSKTYTYTIFLKQFHNTSFRIEEYKVLSRSHSESLFVFHSEEYDNNIAFLDSDWKAQVQEESDKVLKILFKHIPL